MGGSTTAGRDSEDVGLPGSDQPTIPGAGKPLRASQLTRGQALGRYVVIGKLGAGGMGDVYAAYDPELDRRVAIKLVRVGRGQTAEANRARLLREAQAMARISHPHVVAVHDVGTHEGQVYVAMEYVEGVTIKRWLAARE